MCPMWGHRAWSPPLGGGQAVQGASPGGGAHRWGVWGETEAAVRLAESWNAGGPSSPPLAELGAAVDGREGAGGPWHHLEERSRIQQQR